MSALLIATLLQLASSDISIEQAEALARRDEATLHGEEESDFFDKQGNAMGKALANCGVKEAREASGLKVVMRLDVHGRVAQTWLNKPSVLGQCFERELQSATFPTGGRAGFYTFIGFTF
ncbi:hypothetical protein [Pseudoxanthomonas sp. PXM02]|uniref:hypothetical protein n=1 Tax=Pseudoxanthomonas sp. PXM02 TaxID=2769294 RepID=UPI00177B4342|nr:hypothetical protein [Pseudoxanthomonas sp. PXM02]MBD9480134.1 hypothetical protein [Pseudoxanthomonas sp. PXM02]